MVVTELQRSCVEKEEGATISSFFLTVLSFALRSHIKWNKFKKVTHELFSASVFCQWSMVMYVWVVAGYMVNATLPFLPNTVKHF